MGGERQDERYEREREKGEILQEHKKYETKDVGCYCGCGCNHVSVCCVLSNTVKVSLLFVSGVSLQNTVFNPRFNNKRLKLKPHK